MNPHVNINELSVIPGHDPREYMLNFLNHFSSY